MIINEFLNLAQNPDLLRTRWPTNTTWQHLRQTSTVGNMAKRYRQSTTQIADPKALIKRLAGRK